MADEDCVGAPSGRGGAQGAPGDGRGRFAASPLHARFAIHDSRERLKGARP